MRLDFGHFQSHGMRSREKYMDFFTGPKLEEKLLDAKTPKGLSTVGSDVQW